MSRCSLAWLWLVTAILSQFHTSIADVIRKRRSETELNLRGEDIVALKRILSELDGVLGTVQSKACSAPEESRDACALALTADQPSIPADIPAALTYQSGESLVENLARKRLALKLLQKYLADKEGQYDAVQKRNCRINLGGHCATETVADMVDLYHFLSSADSPGRKRRQADASTGRKRRQADANQQLLRKAVHMK